MRTCDSLCENRCRRLARYVVGGCNNAGCVEESIPLHSIQLYLYFDETRPETRKRPNKWADLCEAKAGESSMISLISGSLLL